MSDLLERFRTENARLEKELAEARKKPSPIEVFQKAYKRLSMAEGLSCTQEWFDSEVQKIATNLFEALKGEAKDG